MPYTIVLFYKYTPIEKPEIVASFVRGLCLGLNLKGRVIVASEGINATLEGTRENIEKLCHDFQTDPMLKKIGKNTDFKKSEGNGKSFPRLSVKVRPEIVASGLEKVNPNRLTGKYLNPHELDKLYKTKEDFVVVDMRNDYEYKVGHFRNSIHPGLETFRDLPKVLGKLEPLKNKKIVTVCTGGVRCEKASGYLLQNGFKEVYQLHGGMQRYIEKFGHKDFLGKLYVFDGRVVDAKGEHEVVGHCDICGSPSEKYENCVRPECHKHIIICDNCEKEKQGYCSKECMGV